MFVKRSILHLVDGGDWERFYSGERGQMSTSKNLEQVLLGENQKVDGIQQGKNEFEGEGEAVGSKGGNVGSRRRVDRYGIC